MKSKRHDRPHTNQMPRTCEGDEADDKSPTSGDATKAKTGAARYKAGVLKYAQMGYWDSGLRAQGHRHPGAVPHHPAGRRRADRGRRGRGRRVLHRHLDGGVDRPADRLRPLSRQGLQGRAGAGLTRAVLRLHRLRPEPVRARLDRQRHRLDHRQRVRLQAPEGAAAGGHALPGRLCEDLRGPADRHRRGARAPRQVRPARCWARP